MVAGFLPPQKEQPAIGPGRKLERDQRANRDGIRPLRERRNGLCRGATRQEYPGARRRIIVATWRIGGTQEAAISPWTTRARPYTATTNRRATIIHSLATPKKT